MPYKQMPLNYVVRAKGSKQISAKFLDSKGAKKYGQELADNFITPYIVEGKNYDGSYYYEELEPIPII